MKDLTLIEKVEDLIGEPFPVKKGIPQIRKKFSDLEQIGRLDKKTMLQLIVLLLEFAHEQENKDNI